MPTSWPRECAASITLYAPSSLQTCTISFQGMYTPGQDAMLSIMTTVLFVAELAGTSDGDDRCLSDRRWSRNCSRIEACDIGNVMVNWEIVGCGCRSAI